MKQIQGVCSCTHNVKLIYHIHTCNHEKTVPHHLRGRGGPGHIYAHTPHCQEARLGLGAVGRVADQAAGMEAAREAGSAGS